MPSIPLYGYDELEPSELNRAKRRVIGYEDANREHLTDKPANDPTNGKQNSLVDTITEEIYNTIKDIDILDTYISDDSAVISLRLTTKDVPDTLKMLRPELKKGSAQLATINNALRRINANYDKIRSNMIYTDLKTHTDFMNAVRALKKSASSFYDIVDKLLLNIMEARGEPYERPPIDPSVEADASLVSITPPDPSLTSSDPSLTPPSPDPNLTPPSPDPNLTPTATPVQPTTAPQVPITEDFATMVDRLIASAGLIRQEQQELGIDIGNFMNREGREPDEAEINFMISQIQQGIPPVQGVPVQGVAVAYPSDINDLFVRASKLRPKVDLTGIKSLDRNESGLRKAYEKQNPVIIQKAFDKLELLIKIGEEPLIKVPNSELKSMSPEETTEYNKLFKTYRNYKQTLGQKSDKQDALEKFLNDRGINYTGGSKK